MPFLNTYSVGRSDLIWYTFSCYFPYFGGCYSLTGKTYNVFYMLCDKCIKALAC